MTAGGEVYEGYIRWDRNEGSWADILNGSKEIPWENVREAERLGDEDAGTAATGSTASACSACASPGTRTRTTIRSRRRSGIRFGHLRSLAVLGDDRALLTLKSGEEVELEGGSTDLGRRAAGARGGGPRAGRGGAALAGPGRVDFEAGAAGASAPRGRSACTARSAPGAGSSSPATWPGTWTRSSGSDILDGEERGRGRKIPFDRIAAIERDGSSGARVVLRNGEEITLRDSNDVDDGNRGIADRRSGARQVQVDWDAFESLTFQDAPAEASGATTPSTAARPLGHGGDGGRARYTGTIRWDNDEAYSWEILDGEAEDVHLRHRVGAGRPRSAATARGARRSRSWTGARFRARGIERRGRGQQGDLRDPRGRRDRAGAVAGLP